MVNRNNQIVNSSMKKTYQTAQSETIRIKSIDLMIPASPPEEPHAPERNFVPGPGASYDPQANIL